MNILQLELLTFETFTNKILDFFAKQPHQLNKDKANSLKRRVKLMEKDAKIFKADVKVIIEKLAPELIDESLEQVVPELSNRLSQTEQDLARLEQLQQSMNKNRLQY